MTEKHKTLYNLIAITDAALAHAHKKNIAEVSNCIYIRRNLIESFLDDVKGLAGQQTVLDALSYIIQTDKELQSIMLSLKKKLGKE